MHARAKPQRMLLLQAGSDQQCHLYLASESLQWYARSFGPLGQPLHYPGDRQRVLNSPWCKQLNSG
jgi:hypothetical protein